MLVTEEAALGPSPGWMTALSRPLQVPQRTTQSLDFTLIPLLLAFELLDHFLHILHIVQGFLQRDHDILYLFECFLD